VRGVYYQWRILTSGVSSPATPAEVRATVLDTALNDGFVDPSPVIHFSPMMTTPVKFDRDGDYVDLRSQNIRYSDATEMICHFNLTSRVRCFAAFTNQERGPK